MSALLTMCVEYRTFLGLAVHLPLRLPPVSVAVFMWCLWFNCNRSFCSPQVWLSYARFEAAPLPSSLDEEGQPG